MIHIYPIKKIQETLSSKPFNLIILNLYFMIEYLSWLPFGKILMILIGPGVQFHLAQGNVNYIKNTLNQKTIKTKEFLLGYVLLNSVEVLLTFPLFKKRIIDGYGQLQSNFSVNAKLKSTSTSNLTNEDRSQFKRMHAASKKRELDRFD